MAEGSSFEVSREGIKVPYRRYLSDSAPGFVLLLVLATVHSNHIPIFGIHVRDLLPSLASEEARVLILLLLFLLATPVGLLISALSWLSLEWLQKKVEVLFVPDYLFFNAFKREYMFTACQGKYGFTTKNWFEIVRSCETDLVRVDPGASDRIDPLRGGAILARNLAFLTIGVFLATLYGFLSNEISVPIVALPLMFLLGCALLIVSAAMSFYFHVLIMFQGHKLDPKAGDQRQADNLRDVIEHFNGLIASTTKLLHAVNNIAATVKPNDTQL